MAGVLIEPTAGVASCETYATDVDVVEECRECVSEGGSWDIEAGTCV